jgi:hypothetical protein
MRAKRNGVHRSSTPSDTRGAQPAGIADGGASGLAAPSVIVPEKEGMLIFRLLDRLMHHVHLLTCNGDSYRLADAKRRRAKTNPKTIEDH